MDYQNVPVTVVLGHGYSVEITPEIMAKAFWQMSSGQQAQFFDCLGAVIEEDNKTNKHAYSYGELQWCYLKGSLREPGRERANNVHMALSAFAFDFWPQKLNGARDGI